MERDPKSPVPSKALAGALALALAATLASACAATGSVEQAGNDVSLIAEELVESARQRVELSQLRVAVVEIQGIRPGPVSLRAAAYPIQHEDQISEVLEHEFVIALASRLNVVESELVGPSTAQVPESTLNEVASSYGATHLLVGDYQRSDGLLVVSVRLIDADSKIIVAAARGTVTFPEREQNESWFYGRRWPRVSVAELPPPLDEPAQRAEPSAPPDLAQVEGSEEPPSAEASGASPVAAPAADQSSAPITLPVTSPTGAVEDFETWRKRRQAEQAAEHAGEQAGEVQNDPSADAAADLPSGVEDFETWRQRRQVEQAAVDAGEAVDLAKRLGIPLDEVFPWRKDARLAELLGIPPSKHAREPR